MRGLSEKTSWTARRRIGLRAIIGQATGKKDLGRVHRVREGKIVNVDPASMIPGELHVKIV